MSTIAFTYLPGDGVGMEVGAAALSILGLIADRYGHTVEADLKIIGGAAIDACGAPLPDDTIASVRATGVALLGAVGGPKWEGLPGDQRPEMGLLALRKEMGVFANLRPFAPHPSLADATPFRPEHLRDVDVMVVRELTGGAYFGPKTREGDRAEDVCVYTTAEIERVARKAGEVARKRHGRVTSVDKANVMETSRLWRETVTRVFAQEFPDVALDHILVDAAALYLVTDPRRFDVIVTENMFGDILTDEAASLVGSLGMVPSASLSEGVTGLYEPAHGSAPDIAGKGLANPVAMLRSTALMLRLSFGLTEEANAVDAAVDHAIADGARTKDLAGSTTTLDFTAAVARRLEQPLAA